MMEFVNQIVQGILLGGLYALFAIGLSLSVGVVRLVNLAHGDFIVLVSFLMLTMATQVGIHPFLALALCIPICFVGGYALQRYLLQRVVGRGVLGPFLITFGLSIIIQNGLLEVYGADTRRLSAGTLDTATIPIVDQVAVGVLPLLTLGVTVAVVLALDLVLYRSRLGARIRAVADDVSAANLIGLSSVKIYALATAIIGVTIAFSACFMGLRQDFDPSSGPARLLVAFEVVVLGGLGSLWGTLAGGIVLGVAQSIGAQIGVAWQILAGHLVFLVIFMLRPQGMFPRG